MMPYVDIKITREACPERLQGSRRGATAEQKAEPIAGVTDLLRRILGKNPATTVVAIDEVDTANWGVGGWPVPDYRAAQAAKETQ